MRLQLVRCQNRRFWVLEAHFPAGKARLSLRNAQLHRFGLIKGLRNSSGSHYEEGIYDEGGYVVAGNHFLPHVKECRFLTFQITREIAVRWKDEGGDYRPGDSHRAGLQ